MIMRRKMKIFTKPCQYHTKQVSIKCLTPPVIFYPPKCNSDVREHPHFTAHPRSRFVEFRSVHSHKRFIVSFTFTEGVGSIKKGNYTRHQQSKKTALKWMLTQAISKTFRKLIKLLSGRNSGTEKPERKPWTEPPGLLYPSGMWYRDWERCG